MLIKSGGSHNDSYFASKGFTHTIAGACVLLLSLL
jgi:hypothetical protein